jgi:hypothetical protein
MIPRTKSGKWLTVARDAFARTELLRQLVVKPERKPCKWCGTPAARFRFAVETDGGKFFPIAGEFCSKGCAEDFNA